jgi:hypothetical protein
MSDLMRGGVRPLAAMLLIAMTALLSACLQSTAAMPSVLQLSGSWSYTGVQTAPVRENLTGTLTISSESGTSFQGQLALIGVNVQTGLNRSFSGLVSGSSPGSNVIDFDASVETAPRRHVGQILADTISGTWVGSAPDGTMSSGTFRVERVR